MSIYDITWLGEATDTKPNPSRSNTVVKTMFGVWKLVENANFDHWEMGIIFPDSIKAEFFLKNFSIDMKDFRDGMLRENYIFHVVDFKYPKRQELYADQVNMTADWQNNPFNYN